MKRRQRNDDEDYVPKSSRKSDSEVDPAKKRRKQNGKSAASKNPNDNNTVAATPSGFEASFKKMTYGSMDNKVISFDVLNNRMLSSSQLFLKKRSTMFVFDSNERVCSSWHKFVMYFIYQ